MRQKNPPIARSKISRPSEPDIFLDNLSPSATESPQIPISRNDHSISGAEGCFPRRDARDLTNALRKFFVVQRRQGRIEPDELSELLHAPAHHEAMLSKTLRRFSRRPRRRVPVVVFQRRLVIEPERVPVEIERPFRPRFRHEHPATTTDQTPPNNTSSLRDHARPLPEQTYNLKSQPMPRKDADPGRPSRFHQYPSPSNPIRRRRRMAPPQRRPRRHPLRVSIIPQPPL